MSEPAPVAVRPLALIGPMGAGKSTVGRRVARRTGRPFVDTDARVAAEHGPIPELFAEHGEEAFRRWEAEAAAAALSEPAAVVSLGGGAVLDAGTRRRLADADVVLLMSTAEAVLSRISTAGRPLLAADPSAWQRILDERLPLYRGLAAVTIDTSSRPMDAVVDEVLAWLEGDR